jgi:phosphotransferase family enzyme
MLDILSFIEGDVPAELAYHDDCTLRHAASMIRRFHDVGAEFVSTLGDLPTDAETVCHNDLSPCNFVFRDGVPVAMIDFDAAAPGSRIHDLGYAAWLWLDLGDPAIAQSDQRKRLAIFIDAYGMYETDAVLPAVLKRQTFLAAEGRRTGKIEMMTCTSLLPDQELFVPLSLGDLWAVVRSRGASALRYLKCSMNARSLGETWRPPG